MKFVKILIVAITYVCAVYAGLLDNAKRADYFKKTDNAVPTMDFTLVASEYQQLKQIIGNSGGFFMQSQDFKTKEASMVFTLNGNVQSFDKVTFSLGGVSSRYYPKQAFNIKIHGDNLLFGRKQFRIRSEAREPTMIRSKLFCDMANHLGLPNSVSANYIKMTINGEDLGFYVIMDSLKKSYVEIEYNDKDTTNLIQCKDLNSFLDSKSFSTCYSENDDNPDKSGFQQLLNTLDSANSISQIDQVFDVNTYLKILIIEWLTGSWDHYTLYGHNYSVYKMPNGKWTMTLYDFDATWGQDLSLGLMFRVPAGISTNNVDTWTKAKFEDWIGTNQHVIQVIMNEDKNLFLKTLQDIINDAFNPDVLFNRIDEIKSFISSYVKTDKTPVNGVLPGRLNPKSNCYDYTYEQFDNNSEFTTIPTNFNGMSSYSYGLKKWILDKFVFVCNNYSVDCSVGKDYLNNFDPNNATKKTNNASSTTYTNPLVENPTSSSSSCWATKLGYNCCSDPNTSVYYEDQDGQWGLENNNWCVIQKSSSSQVSCWSKALGFDCCSSCGPVYHTDNDGRWSVVDGKWCGLPSNC